MSASGIHEQNVAEAFSRQSAVFDDIYCPNLTIQYKRERVRAHVNAYLPASSHILELNSGTGEDTLYFAQQGHTIHATDIATGMQQKLKEKIATHGLTSAVTTEICSFTELERLEQKGPYDLIFSNFAGLNCTGELDKVLQSFEPLLKPGGVVTLVLLPPFCLWETFLALRGQFRTAFRRLNSKNGRQAHIEGVFFTCWYYKPFWVAEQMKDQYELLGLEGLCTIVPPSFYENFPNKRPRLFRFLQKWEHRLRSAWPWRNIGDYYIISFRKRL